jgi:hypothetical protein
MSTWSTGAQWLAVAALLAAASVAPGAHAGQDAAKRYFQNGVDLITAAQPNYQDAYYQFQLAYKESGSSWKVLGNLGLCALKLERDQEAVAYYEQYLREGGADIAAEERQAIEQDLLLLKGNLATVRITSPVQDLKIIDRRAGSQAPAQSYTLQGGSLELQLRAGNHNITASSGNKRLSWDVVLEPKSVSAHVFDFDQPSDKDSASAAAPAAPAAGGDAGPSKGSSLRIPAYVALGLGGAGIGLGGYFAWQSADYDTQAEAAFACNRMPPCPVAQEREVRRLEGESGSAQTRAIVGFSVGGALAVTGVVLLIVGGPSSSDSAQQARLVPWIGPRELGVIGSF